MSYEYKSGTQLLEERYITFDEVGLTGPDQTPSKLWSWGNNYYGNLGLGDTTNKSSPVQVGSLTNWKSISAGNAFTNAVKTDGTLWSWGSNYAGELGLGDITHRSSPIQVGSLTNWKQVSLGESRKHNLAIKTDGTLWAWGKNSSGELGLGDITDRSSPVQVGALTNWKYVAAGSSYFSGAATFAIKTDGTLWAWGRNYKGNLGLGDTTDRSSPVQVGALNNWKQVSSGNVHALAIKTDGTLWAWGYNSFGHLGLGDRTHRSSPVQVGALTNWKQVSSGWFSPTAVKTDGTLWAWGLNSFGALGLSDIVHRSSPVQVGALTDWNYVSSCDVATVAIKTDGTLWAIGGENTTGQLGDGTITKKSSPIQIGSLTNWKSVSAGQNNTSALQLNT